MKYINKFMIFLFFVFIILPFIFLILVSFTSNEVFQVGGFSFKWYVEAISSSNFKEAILNSLIVSLISTVISISCGFLFSLGLYKKRSKYLEAYVDMPLIIPHIVLSFILYQFFVVKFGIDSTIILILANVVVAFPYIIKSFLAALNKIDKNIFLAGKTLGANELTIVKKVLLPNISSTLVAVSFISFINAFNNLSIALFLIKPGSYLLPNQMMSYLEFYYDPTIAALSVIIIIITVIILFIFEKKFKISLIDKGER